MCQTTIHPFERSGLGKAPFQFVGQSENVYSPAPGIQQPGGTCDHCGTGIRYEFHIQSADGRVSKVGCDCILKLNRTDNRFVVEVEKARMAIERKARQVKTEARKNREDDRINAAFGRLSDPMVAERFAVLPHPRGFTDRRTGYPLSLANYIAWMEKNAFHSGHLDTAKLIEKTLS